MLKEVKRCYFELDLPYSATEEEIETRRDVLIKIEKSKGNEKKPSNKKRIERLQYCAKTILNYLKKNPKIEDTTHFKTTGFGLMVQLYILLMVSILCGVSFFAIL